MNCLGVETGERKGNVGVAGFCKLTWCIFWLLRGRKYVLCWLLGLNVLNVFLLVAGAGEAFFAGVFVFLVWFYNVLSPLLLRIPTVPPPF